VPPDVVRIKEVAEGTLEKFAILLLSAVIEPMGKAAQDPHSSNPLVFFSPGLPKEGDIRLVKAYNL
jgi:hypothetical protein